MANTNNIGNISFPYLIQDIEHFESVNPIRKNLRDTNGVTFVVKGNPTETIKWCRRNFGERGDGWDFTAGTRHVQITMWSSKLITMYELWMN